MAEAPDERARSHSRGAHPRQSPWRRISRCRRRSSRSWGGTGSRRAMSPSAYASMARRSACRALRRLIWTTGGIRVARRSSRASRRSVANSAKVRGLGTAWTASVTMVIRPLLLWRVAPQRRGPDRAHLTPVSAPSIGPERHLRLTRGCRWVCEPYVDARSRVGPPHPPGCADAEDRGCPCIGTRQRRSPTPSLRWGLPHHAVGLGKSHAVGSRDTCRVGVWSAPGAGPIP
jgi:hypothetical protein